MSSFLSLVKLLDLAMSIFEKWIKRQTDKKLIDLGEIQYRSKMLSLIVERENKARELLKKEITDEEKRDLDNFFNS